MKSSFLPKYEQEIVKIFYPTYFVWPLVQILGLQPKISKDFLDH